ncbi:hypothetical protein NRF22_03815 [Oenococcus kitaharae]|uniref:hypothetical protein n=1 Tax=Oenococcus TaxID=46254 RepID=UPI0021E90A76|nr:hypothetical protein [Oenococcus kitaharae]MCV3296240.1 hypothetical protein [Oenococcus kitaharae]
MGIKDKLQAAYKAHKQRKRFEKYHEILTRHHNISLSDLSSETQIPLAQVQEDCQALVQSENDQDTFFKQRFYLTDNKTVIHTVGFIDSMKHLSNLKPAFFALISLFVVACTGLVIMLFMSKEPAPASHAAVSQQQRKRDSQKSLKTKSKHTAQASSTSQQTSHSDGSSTQNALDYVFVLRKDQHELSLSDGDGKYLGKSSGPQRITIPIGASTLVAGSYQVKWAPGSWNGSDPDTAYGTTEINDQESSLQQVMENAPVSISLHDGDRLTLQMFGKGTGDTLKFFKK